MTRGHVEDEDIEEGLADLFGREENPEIPATGAQLLARARVRSRRRTAARVGAAVGLVLTIGFAVALVGGDEGQRALVPRGLAGSPGVVALSWVVEGADGPRRGTGPVRIGEQVVFSATAGADGYFCLDEQRDGGWSRVLPLDGEVWAASVGTSLARTGGEAAAFVSDEGPGQRRYRLAWSPHDPACEVAAAVDVGTIVWES